VSLAPATLRQRIESGLVAVLGALSPAWRVSTLAYDLFPGADLADREALSFAVGLPSTSFLPGRQQQASGLAAVETVVGVKFTSQLRADASVTDYDTALAREVALINAVLDVVGDRGPTPVVTSVRREITGDGTVFLGTILFDVFHGYPLT
jgi:hypothetical protein